jgi:predicted transcriptional regulator
MISHFFVPQKVRPMSLHRPHFFRPKKWISFVSVLRANWEFQVDRGIPFSVQVDKPNSRSYTSGMKTAISLPDELFRRAEQYTRRVKKTRSCLYSDAMREYLDRHSVDEVTQRMNSVCGRVHEPLDPFLREAGRRLLKKSSW